MATRIEEAARVSVAERQRQRLIDRTTQKSATTVVWLHAEGKRKLTRAIPLEDAVPAEPPPLPKKRAED